MSVYRDQLREIRSFPSLVRFLRDELGWPIETEDFEDLTFDYAPEELGIDPANAAKIDEIKRLRPLVASQPWGIFFVKFEPKQLPVVALRRILAGVVIKKRATASSAELPKWAEDDLLFISNYGEGEERRISFAHFSRDTAKKDLPTLKVIAWDELDTPLHLEHIADVLVERLAWPTAEEAGDEEKWRERWRSAFELRHREVISTSKLLAEHLAELARNLRGEILRVIEIESEDGKVRQLMNTFRRALVHDMDSEGFADMYAQTIAYGLLSARIADPEKATADDFGGHMRTNPFLRELMEAFLRVSGRRGSDGEVEVDFDELGVSDVTRLLDDANIEAIVRDFGDRNPLEDPVMHFYELFLASYDPEKRLKRGVFYTPRPIVAAMVHQVDATLREEGYADGLADPAVSVLDPAVGTGTFLVEVIDRVHETLAEKWRLQGSSPDVIRAKWNEYVPRELLPRIYGFEIMMAPYAIAHLKIGLKLQETGYEFASNARVNVVLTDSLQRDEREGEQLELLIPAMAREAKVAKAAKAETFSVVIGNPPYRNNSDLTLAQVAQRFPPLLETSKDAAQAQVRNIRDDYAWFYAAADAYVSREGGVVCLVTSDSYTRIGSYRYFREQVLRRYRVSGLTLVGQSVFREVSPRISFAILELVARGSPVGDTPVDAIDVTDIRALAEEVRPTARASAADPRLVLLSEVAAGKASMPLAVQQTPSAERKWSFLLISEELVARVLTNSLPIYKKSSDCIFAKKWPGIITAFDDLLKAREAGELAERMESFFQACHEPKARRHAALREWAERHGIGERWSDRVEHIADEIVRKGVRFAESRVKRSVSGSIPNELRWWPPPAYRHYIYYEPRIKIPRNVNVGKVQGWGSMEQWRDDDAHRITPKLIFTTSTNPRAGYKAFVVDDEWFVKLHGGTSQQYNFTGLHVGADSLGPEASLNNLAAGGLRIAETLRSFGLDDAALLHFVAAVHNSSLAERFLAMQSGEELRVRLPSKASGDLCVAIVRQARLMRALHQLLYDGQAPSIGWPIGGIDGLSEADGQIVALRENSEALDDELQGRIAVEQRVLDELVDSYYGVELAEEAA